MVFIGKIIGKPNPSIQWYFGAVKINSDKTKYELLRDDAHHHILVIKNVTINDQGEYTCQARNCKGDASWSANLYFNKAIVSKTTELSSLANNYLEKLNGIKELNFNNFMNEDYYEKMKEYEDSSIEDLIKNLNDVHEKINNLESNLNDSDLDRKQMFVELDANHIDESTNELVKNMPKILQDLKSEQSVYKTTEPFSITLVAQGDNLIVEWYRDEEKVIPLINQIEFIKMDHPKTYELVFNFNSPVVADSGIYYCSISNRFGSLMSAKVPIKIIDPEQDDVVTSENTSIFSNATSNKTKRKVRFSLPRDSDVFLIPFHKTQIPTPPGQPSIFDFKRTSLLLKWLPSKSDLNFYDNEDRDLDSQSNLSYLIEYITAETNVWAVFASNIADLNTYVDNLNPNVVYSFRVRAENQVGISDVSPSVTTKGLLYEESRRSPPETNHIIHSRFRREFISFDLNQPTIGSEQKDINYFVEGQTAEVSMLVFGYPLPEVKWMRHRKIISPDNKKYKMHSDRFSYYHLEVLNTTSEDEGLYQLVASNDTGKICIHDIYLQQADPPVFIETFSDTKAKSYQDVYLTCRIEGIPAPEIKFYKDKFRLVESVRVKIKHNKPDVWIIHINNALASDSGLYSCAVKNMAGESVCSCNLVVEQEMIMPFTEPKKIYSSTRARAESVDYMTKEEEMKEKAKEEAEAKVAEEMTFNSELFEEEDLDLAEGAFLLPVVDTSLLVRIREYRREANLTNGNAANGIGKFAIKERIEVDSNGQLSRAGSLSRELDSEASMRRSESMDRSLSKTPELTKSQSTDSFNSLMNNEFVGLYIRLSQDGPMKPFVNKNQKEESPRERAKTPASIELESKKESIKLGKKLNNSDSALDYYNQKNSTERLAPIVREKLKDVFLIDGATLTLECKIEGNPKPRYFWYHDNKIIHTNDDRIKITQTDDGKLRLTILNAKKSDLGNYRCTAMNRYGITVATAKVTPAQLPDRPSKPIVYQYSDVIALLTWQSPAYNDNSGNSNILGFKVDFKRSDEFRWSNALYTTDERCLVTDLEPLTKYRFRVSCINSFGFSQYSWASEECETLPFGYSNITIESKLFEDLLDNRYDLLKSEQQWMLVKKPKEERKQIKIIEETKSDSKKPLLKQKTPTPPRQEIPAPEPIKPQQSFSFANTVTAVTQTNKIKENILRLKEAIAKPTKPRDPTELPSLEIELNDANKSKSNEFEKFKTAYLSSHQEKPKPKTPKYLQLY